MLTDKSFNSFREGVNDMRTRVRVGYGILLATYLSVELSILLGCPSVHKNWQIFPDTGSKLNLKHHTSVAFPVSPDRAKFFCLQIIANLPSLRSICTSPSS